MQSTVVPFPLREPPPLLECNLSGVNLYGFLIPPACSALQQTLNMVRRHPCQMRCFLVSRYSYFTIFSVVLQSRHKPYK